MANNRSVKDKEMASMLKKLGITRTSSNCPICHHLIGLNALPLHVYKCKGRKR